MTEHTFVMLSYKNVQNEIKVRQSKTLCQKTSQTIVHDNKKKKKNA